MGRNDGMKTHKCTDGMCGAQDCQRCFPRRYEYEAELMEPEVWDDDRADYAKNNKRIEL